MGRTCGFTLMLMHSYVLMSVDCFVLISEKCERRRSSSTYDVLTDRGVWYNTLLNSTWARDPIPCALCVYLRPMIISSPHLFCLAFFPSAKPPLPTIGQVPSSMVFLPL